MSNSISTRPIGELAIFGCGGGGINIAKEYIDANLSADIANLSVALLDTSDSNLSEGNLSNFYAFSSPDGVVDGSGKVKAKNAELISRSIAEVLRKFPPKAMNIIVYTASGGTGNVAGYCLHKALLAAGHDVVSVVIASAESERTAKNTIGTLLDLSDLAEEVGKPVVIHYGMNGNGVTRAMVDKEAHLIITSLAILASRRNYGLDTADLKSFLNYTLPRPDIKPTLARINVYDNVDTFDRDVKEPISVAYLKRNADEPQPEAFAPYFCDGILPDVAQASNLFFAIETSSLYGVHADLTKLRDELASRESTRQAAPAFGSIDGGSARPKGGMRLD